MKRSYFFKLVKPVALLLASNIGAFAQTVFPVPNVPGCRGVSGVIVNMRGGSGGASNSSGTSFPNGGSGGFAGSVACTLDVITPTVITSLTYYVGQQGAVGTPVLTGLGGSAGGAGYGTGGNGGSFLGPTGSVGTNCPGGGGGGSSAVLNTAGAVPLLIAAGGGGGGALITTLNGGNGGSVGTAGTNAGTYNYGGGGGTPGVGGAGGVGLNNNGAAGAGTFPGNGGTGGTGQQGSQSGGGGGAGYGAGGGGGAGNLPGVGSTIGVNTATGAGGGGANYVAPTAVTTGLANGTATVRGNGIVTLAYFPDTIGGNCTTLCPGSTVTFTETTPGGVWSSSNTTIATVSATSGSSIVVTAGTSTGVTNISYTDPASGHYAFIVVTVLNAPSPISGLTSLCVGQTIPLSNSLAGGVWSSGAPPVATVGAATGVVTGVSAGNAVISYTAPGGCPATHTVTVVSAPAPVANQAICVGNTVMLSNSLAGGVWSSSNTAIGSIDPVTGVASGLSVGNTTITYTFGLSCFTTATLTVNPLPSPVAGLTSVCVGQTIPLSNAATGGVWTSGAPAVATVGSASGVVTGVSAGNAVITYTAPGGCSATHTVTVISAPAPVADQAICVGNTVALSNSLAGGVWSSSDATVGSIDPVTGIASGLSAGITTITYTFGSSCFSIATLTVNPLPVISAGTKGPTTCFGSDGSITLGGLASGTTYSVEYSFNGTPVPTLTLTASAGSVVLSGLSSGSYTGIQVTNTVTGCVSNIVTATLTDPTPPPPPIITSNQPICVDQTLKLEAYDAAPVGGFYSWTGPHGFTSSIQNPVIEFATLANSGIYTVTYTIWNCVSLPASANIAVDPPSPLTNVTLNQTISYGTSIQLNAENAYYYVWKPFDGTVDNPNINNPIATPLTTTTYTVYGRSLNGCVDSAFVTIIVDSTLNTGIPSAFTPNGDGLNDIFRPIGLKYSRLVDFRIVNRWGQEVFYSNSNEKGWDGTFNGTPVDAGVYYYQIIVAQPGGAGTNISYKGDVTLVR